MCLKVLEFARSAGVQGVGSGEYLKFECFVLIALMKCVLFISLFKNNTVKLVEEGQPIFAQSFAVLGPAEISATPEFQQRGPYPRWVPNFIVNSSFFPI